MRKNYRILTMILFFLVLTGGIFWYQTYNILNTVIASDILEEKKPRQKSDASQTVKAGRDSVAISQICASLLANMHYVKRQATREQSVRFFHEYLKRLDPQKMFFTGDHVNNWLPEAPEMLNQLVRGNPGMAFLIYNQYLTQLQKYEDFINEFSVSAADLKTNEVLTADRKKADWPEDHAALRDMWRKKLTNDVILLEILERIDAEKKKENKTKWKKLSSLEQVKKRARQFITEERNATSVGVIEHYLNALASLYDPHTEYMAPETEEDFNINMSLSLFGIGAVLSTADDGSTRIVKLIPGGPAMKNGNLHADDRIIAVAQGNQEPVDVIDMPLKKVVSLIRGPAGSEVVLTVLDAKMGSNSAAKTVRMIREEIELKESEAKSEVRMIKDSSGTGRRIGIITLPSFYHDFEGAAAGKKDYKSSTKDVQKLLREMQKEGAIDALVMDLRYNGGGSLSEAVLLTGLFIPEGPVVQVLEADGSVKVEYDTDRGNVDYSGPLIVLTSRYSASASEIFAGAIQDYGRGIIAGDSRTHGKGTVQTVVDINQYFNYLGIPFKGGSLKLTRSKFYRINGASTQLKGVEPDLVIPSYTDAMEQGEEQLDNPLPWDTIKPAVLIEPSPIPGIAKKLKTGSDLRIKNSAEWQIQNAAIERFRKNREKKTISLNFDVRWKEYQEQKRLLDEQEDLYNKLSGDSGNKKTNDLCLDEVSRIAADYAEIMKK